MTDGVQNNNDRSNKKREKGKKGSAATPFGFSCGDTARRAGGRGAVRWGGGEHEHK